MFYQFFFLYLIRKKVEEKLWEESIFFSKKGGYTFFLSDCTFCHVQIIQDFFFCCDIHFLTTMNTISGIFFYR